MNASQTGNVFTTADGTAIYYRDWGTGDRTIVFCHGWPLSGDAWDNQLLYFSTCGYRVIAHDRRGHGRSGQPTRGNDMDTYADDLAALLDCLDVKNAVLVGHSTGGGEVARYIGRHGTARVSKAVLISAVPPIMIVSPTNPGGSPKSVFDGLREAVSGNRSQFYRELAMPFFGFNKAGATASEGTIDAFWLESMQGGIYGHYACIEQFSETDFTGDLKKFDVPTLFMHGDADQIVPIGDASLLSAKIVANSTLKVYPGAPHGLCVTLASTVNADLRAFIELSA